MFPLVFTTVNDDRAGTPGGPLSIQRLPSGPVVTVTGSLGKPKVVTVPEGVMRFRKRWALVSNPVNTHRFPSGPIASASPKVPDGNTSMKWSAPLGVINPTPPVAGGI